MDEIVQMTGLSMKKVSSVLGQSTHGNINLVSDEEMAIILHAAAEIGYTYVRGSKKGGKRKKVTMEMVAKEAGVTLATVQVALALDKGKITNETRTHVRKIAALMGYKPTKKHNLIKFYKRKSD